MRRLRVLAALLVALPADAVTMDWVYIGDPGNAPDTATNCLNSDPTCGSVVGPNFFDPTVEVGGVGFRVARLVPEPAQVLLVLTGGLVLAVVRRKRRA